MTEKERALLVGIANILRMEYRHEGNDLEYDIGGMLDELEKEDKIQEEYEQMLRDMRE